MAANDWDAASNLQFVEANLTQDHWSIVPNVMQMSGLDDSQPTPSPAWQTGAALGTGMPSLIGTEAAAKENVRFASLAADLGLDLEDQQIPDGLRVQAAQIEAQGPLQILGPPVIPAPAQPAAQRLKGQQSNKQYNLTEECRP